MSDRPTTDRATSDGSRSVEDPGQQYAPDRDLNIKGVVLAGMALAVATGLAALVSWWLALGLRGFLEERDPAPPALMEARAPHEPPSPNLQTDPATELAEVRAEEEAILGTYQWSDATESSATVPIERGMQLLLETRPGAEAFGDEGAAEAQPQENDER